MSEHITLETVARLIRDFYPSCGGTLILYACNRQVGITRKKELPRLSSVITTFNSTDINEGLTPAHWNKIHGKILSLIQKGELL